MKRIKAFNPLALLGFIGFVGIIGFFGGCAVWFIFFTWFIWFAWIKRPVDERFYKNIDRASRNGFIISMVGVAFILALLGLKAPYEKIIIAIVCLFETLLFGFLISLLFYDKRGY